MIQQKCLVISCEEVAAKTYLLRFVSSEITASVCPGQFVNVQAAEINQGPLLRRPFSVSRVDGDIADILFHVIGAGTDLLSKKQRGDNINIIGPLGQGFHIDADYDDAIIVAGGIGVAPFPLLTTYLQKRNKHIETFLGFKNSGFLFTSHLSNIHISTDDGSQGFHGNVVQLIESYFSQNKFSKAKIFACGPTVMLKALTEYAKRNRICCELSLEGQMACGVGICQGCAVERSNSAEKYALVCKDGPTFISTEVNL